MLSRTPDAQAAGSAARVPHVWPLLAAPLTALASPGRRPVRLVLTLRPEASSKACTISSTVVPAGGGVPNAQAQSGLAGCSGTHATCKLAMLINPQWEARVVACPAKKLQLAWHGPLARRRNQPRCLHRSPVPVPRL